MNETIQKAITDHVEDQRKQVARSAVRSMETMILNLKYNIIKLEPQTPETLVEWMEQERDEFKRDFNI
jgi:hypothetical protein